MQLKVTPAINPRYWVAISIASMCGTNLGDFLPDILKLSPGPGLLILAGLFATLVLAERSSRGSEAFYWLAILIVRAAATNIADFSIWRAHLGFGAVSAALAVLMVGLVALQRRSGSKPTTGVLPPTNGLYWFTMLTAGSLGTVIGDGVGHSFHPVSVGVPISASLATIALLGILTLRMRLGWTTLASYWTAVVAVRWWGTNLGDITAFLLSLLPSTILTGSSLAAILLLWRGRPVQMAGIESETVSPGQRA